METSSNTPQTPYIIQTGGNSSAVKPIVFGLLAVAGVFFGYKEWQKYKERQAEKNLDTPEGQIAMQLKNVFESTIVSDEDFRQVYLQVNSSNKDEVFKQYRALTQRNLSDDIANRIGKGTLTKAVKTEAINSKPNGAIKIDQNDNISFSVAKGSKVVFTNPKIATWLYASVKGIIWNLTASDVRPRISEFDKIKVSVVNRTAVMTVDKTMILPYEGVKLSQDWTKYFRPIVNTRKVFAVVRVAIKDNKGLIKYLWVDARDISTVAGLKGVTEFKCIGELVF